MPASLRASITAPVAAASLATAALAVVSAVACGPALAQTSPVPDGAWRGSVAASAAGSAGNTENLSIGIKADAVRQTDSDKLGVQLQQVLSTSTRADTGDSELSGQIFRLSGRYERNIVDRWFAFGALDYEHDKLAGVRHRVLPQLGGGYHAIVSDRTTFDVFGGFAFNRTVFYVDPGIREAELLVGEESTHKIGRDTVLSQRLAIFAPFDDPTGAYRVQFDAGIVTRITGGLGLTVNLTERYSAQPAVGKRRSDVQFFVGVQYGWDTL